MSSSRCNFRSFTSFILAWALIALATSGVVLYIAPAGRIANWTAWRLALLSKDQWRSVHTLTAILFLAGGAFHLFKFNWNPFVAYLRRRGDAKRPFQYELLASLVLFLLIVAGTIARQVPFQTVMSAGASIRESWESASNNPPIPHMEEIAVAQLSDSLKVETPQLMGTLDQLGLKSKGEDESLQDLAKRNGRSPEQVYKALETKLHSPGVPEGDQRFEQQAGGGVGRGRGQGFKSLAELAPDYGLSAEAAVRRLAAKGIAATAQDRLRDIASRSGLRPYELLEILQKETQK